MEVVLVKLVCQIVLPVIVLSFVLQQLMVTMFLLTVVLENIPAKWLNVLRLVPLVLIREIFVYLVLLVILSKDLTVGEIFTFLWLFCLMEEDQVVFLKILIQVETNYILC